MRPFLLNPMQVALVAIHHAADVLEQRQSRLAFSNRSEEGRESVTVVPVPALKSPNAEGLARRPSNHGHDAGREPGLGGQECLVAVAAQILPVGRACGRVHFVALGSKSGCFEAEREAAAAREEIQYEREIRTCAELEFTL